MQYNNRPFGAITKPLKESPYIQSFEQVGSPVPPPVQCFLAIHPASGGGLLSIHPASGGGNLSIHCPGAQLNLIDYLDNQYIDYQGSEYIEIQ